MSSYDWMATNVSSLSSSSGMTCTLTAPVTYYSGGSMMAAPRPQTALEWLDAEIEATCRLARQAG